MCASSNHIKKPKHIWCHIVYLNLQHLINLALFLHGPELGAPLVPLVVRQRRGLEQVVQELLALAQRCQHLVPRLVEEGTVEMMLFKWDFHAFLLINSVLL